tara:strand:- start:932 stop:1135 length:204 start_codon:yes stop_codon:yes gene_type:complete
MRYTPKTTLPLEDLKTQALLDTLEELCNLHESAMLSTTRVFFEQQIVLIHAELDVREETNNSWGIKN